LGYDEAHSYYQIKTHFGRHGDVAALQDPFKRPLLLAKTGAVFSLPEERSALYLGQGIGNSSRTQAGTVHQGYAPVIPLSGVRRLA
jgi:CRISPR-associated protein Csm4